MARDLGFILLGALFGVVACWFIPRLPRMALDGRRELRRLWWRWLSRNPGGRPPIQRDLVDLIRRMSLENPLWGAPRIHGELLKLGLRVAQSTVSRYMVPRPDRPRHDWLTFMRSHADAIASIDLFAVQVGFVDQAYAVVVLGHGRRRILHVEATDRPTAEWLARAITEAFPWDEAPTYLVRDNDGAYGLRFRHRLRAMGIRDKPT